MTWEECEAHVSKDFPGNVLLDLPAIGKPLLPQIQISPDKMTCKPSKALQGWMGPPFPVPVFNSLKRWSPFQAFQGHVDAPGTVWHRHIALKTLWVFRFLSRNWMCRVLVWTFWRDAWFQPLGLWWCLVSGTVSRKVHNWRWSLHVNVLGGIFQTYCICLNQSSIETDFKREIFRWTD